MIVIAQLCKSVSAWNVKIAEILHSLWELLILKDI